MRLAKKLSPETVQRIEDMNLRGVFFQKENRRVYPQHELAAHVLGYVDVDEKGNGGIEYSLDKQIRGRPGKMMVMADGRRRWYDRTESAADPGAKRGADDRSDDSVHRRKRTGTRDRGDAREERHGGGAGSEYRATACCRRSGRRLIPTMPGNFSGRSADGPRGDRPLTSLARHSKWSRMTGAIENGAAKPADLVDCQMGSILVAGRLIHDWHPFGVLSVREVLAHSSDVGSIKIALRLGAPKFYETMRAFGIGQLTGIELPGENRGLLRPLENWTASSIGSLAIGQEVSVTPVQIVSAISAIANGGTLYRPRIVTEVRGGRVGVHARRSCEPEQVTDAKDGGDGARE